MDEPHSPAERSSPPDEAHTPGPRKPTGESGQVSAIPSQLTNFVEPIVQRSPKWPLRLGILLGILTLLCAGVVLVGYEYYDNATQPHRSSPETTVDNYLQSYLVDRDDRAAEQYSCVATDAVNELVNFRSQLEESELRIGNTISSSWSETGIEDVSAVRKFVDVTITESSGEGSTVNTISSNWRLDVRQTDGWRVCGAHQLS